MFYAYYVNAPHLNNTYIQFVIIYINSKNYNIILMSSVAFDQ